MMQHISRRSCDSDIFFPSSSKMFFIFFYDFWFLTNRIFDQVRASSLSWLNLSLPLFPSFCHHCSSPWQQADSYRPKAWKHPLCQLRLFAHIQRWEGAEQLHACELRPQSQISRSFCMQDNMGDCFVVANLDANCDDNHTLWTTGIVPCRQANL